MKNELFVSKTQRPTNLDWRCWVKKNQFFEQIRQNAIMSTSFNIAGQTYTFLRLEIMFLNRFVSNKKLPLQTVKVVINFRQKKT